MTTTTYTFQSRDWCLFLVRDGRDVGKITLPQSLRGFSATPYYGLYLLRDGRCPCCAERTARDLVQAKTILLRMAERAATTEAR